MLAALRRALLAAQYLHGHPDRHTLDLFQTPCSPHSTPPHNPETRVHLRVPETPAYRLTCEDAAPGGPGTGCWSDQLRCCGSVENPLLLVEVNGPRPGRRVGADAGAVALALLSPVVGRLSDRLSVRPPILAGLGDHVARGPVPLDVRRRCSPSRPPAWPASSRPPATTRPTPPSEAGLGWASSRAGRSSSARGRGAGAHRGCAGRPTGDRRRGPEPAVRLRRRSLRRRLPGDGPCPGRRPSRRVRAADHAGDLGRVSPTGPR
jgi:hypothetical protein